mmetsp:Transcript_119481/g.338132  ORF Transcript_119481/g.338132 Transcript_119481/m.338132 type:complete len:495 (+) Transcript_119481:1676-3160(+)
MTVTEEEAVAVFQRARRPVVAEGHTANDDARNVLLTLLLGLVRTVAVFPILRARVILIFGALFRERHEHLSVRLALHAAHVPFDADALEDDVACRFATPDMRTLRANEVVRASLQGRIVAKLREEGHESVAGPGPGMSTNQTQPRRHALAVLLLLRRSLLVKSPGQPELRGDGFRGLQFLDFLLARREQCCLQLPDFGLKLLDDLRVWPVVHHRPRLDLLYRLGEGERGRGVLEVGARPCQSADDPRLRVAGEGLRKQKRELRVPEVGQGADWLVLAGDVPEFTDEVRQMKKRGVDMAHLAEPVLPVAARGLVLAPGEVHERHRAVAVTPPFWRLAVRARLADIVLHPEVEHRVAPRGPLVHRRRCDRPHLVAEFQQLQRLLRVRHDVRHEPLNPHAMLRVHMHGPLAADSARPRAGVRCEEVVDLLVVDLVELAAAFRVFAVYAVVHGVYEPWNESSGTAFDVWSRLVCGGVAAQHRIRLSRARRPVREDAHV